MLEKKESGAVCVASRSSAEEHPPGAWLGGAGSGDSEGEDGLVHCKGRRRLPESVLPPEVVYFDESGDKCCISSASNKSEEFVEEPSNLVIQVK
jgi:hypothetical protein